MTVWFCWDVWEVIETKVNIVTLKCWLQLVGSTCFELANSREKSHSAARSSCAITRVSSSGVRVLCGCRRGCSAQKPREHNAIVPDRELSPPFSAVRDIIQRPHLFALAPPLDNVSLRAPFICGSKETPRT